MNFSLGFLLNAIICGGISTFYYKYTTNENELMKPKLCGSNTCLFFMSVLCSVR